MYDSFCVDDVFVLTIIVLQKSSEEKSESIVKYLFSVAKELGGREVEKPYLSPCTGMGDSQSWGMGVSVIWNDAS